MSTYPGSHHAPPTQTASGAGGSVRHGEGVPGSVLAGGEGEGEGEGVGGSVGGIVITGVSVAGCAVVTGGSVVGSGGRVATGSIK